MFKKLGWEVIPVSSLGKLNRGVSYKKNEAFNEFRSGMKPILRANNINGSLIFRDLIYVPISRIKEEQLIRAGDVIFAMSSGSREHVGKSAQAIRDFDGGYGAFCSSFRPIKYLNKRFVGYFFQTPFYRNHIRLIAKGTNINNLKREHILDLDFPLPSSKEQNKIVEIIEEIFSDLDNAIDNLKKAKEQLKIYRQSVLKYAFEGKLTKSWRNNNKTEINHESLPEEVSGEAEDELPNLPKEWFYTFLSKTGELSRGKSKHRPRNDLKLFGGKYPFIQTGEVRAVKTIRFFSKTYNEVGLSQSKLWPIGTLCITIAANIAETAFLDIEACFPDSIVGYLPNKNLILPKYTDYFIQSTKQKIQAYAPATAQKNINLTILENLLVPYCSIEEQEQIVQEIESRFSVCDKIEETINDGLKQAKALRQSILKKSFEGKLTEKWRKDNPELIAGKNSAKALLEKINSKNNEVKVEKKKEAVL